MNNLGGIGPVVTSLRELSDLHLKADALNESLVFPGPVKIPAHLADEAETLLRRCKAFTKNDFMVSLSGCFFRGRVESRAVDGTWFILRQIPAVAPQLSTLPTPLPDMVKTMLMSESLHSGGLVYIVGAGGSGKTSTASAVVTSRLIEYGGMATTIEDPPEMPLNGWHGSGYCRQTWVAGEGSTDWAESFRTVLRSQPAATKAILYVGEVRDQESAQAMLRAAGNGFLVVATGFGTDLISGLDALVRLTGQDSLAAFAGLLRLVIHQTLIDHNMLVATTLASGHGNSMAAIRIRTGQLNQLLNDIQQQGQMMRNDKNPLEL